MNTSKDKFLNEFKKGFSKAFLNGNSNIASLSLCILIVSVSLLIVVGILSWFQDYYRITQVYSPVILLIVSQVVAVLYN